MPHALEQMERRGISEEEVAAMLEDPNEEGSANFGRLYAQSVIDDRRIRVVYNRGTDEAVGGVMRALGARNRSEVRTHLTSRRSG